MSPYIVIKLLGHHMQSSSVLISSTIFNIYNLC